MGIVYDAILGRLRRDDSPASQAEMEAATEGAAVWALMATAGS